MSLPDVVHRFKTLTTKRYADGVKTLFWPRFHRRLWQRNYFEHIIRDDAEGNLVHEYIVYNPERWGEDEENPYRKAEERPG
jgi:REP element-mobilizing transposase RayT